MAEKAEQHEQGDAPPKEAQAAEGRDIEDLHAIIGKVEDPRSRRGLESEDPQIVGAVVETVRTARAEAEEAGTPLSDRDIYLAFRKAVEVDDPDPRAVKACSVLTNFLGDNPSGHLPF